MALDGLYKQLVIAQEIEKIGDEENFGNKTGKHIST
jgi:hypothetical protein